MATKTTSGKSKSASQKKPAKDTVKEPAKEPVKQPKAYGNRKARGRFGALVCVLLAAFTFIGFSDSDAVIINFLRTSLRGLAGGAFYVLPFLLLISAAIIAFRKTNTVKGDVVCLLLLCVTISAFIHLGGCKTEYVFDGTIIRELWVDGGKFAAHGGLLGGIIAVGLTLLVTKAGAVIVLIVVSLYLVFGATGLTFSGIINAYRNRPKKEPEEAEPTEFFAPHAELPEGLSRKKKNFKADVPLSDTDHTDEKLQPEPYSSYATELSKPTVTNPAKPGSRVRELGKDTLSVDSSVEADPNSDSLEVFTGKVSTGKTKSRTAKSGGESAFGELIVDYPDTADGTIYQVPPITLLDAPPAEFASDGDDEKRTTARRLEQAFRDFGKNVKIRDAKRGASVTRYEAELESGVKLNSIVNLAQDIALSLGVSGLRIAAMPDKMSTVGIEVPNKTVSTVYLREILESDAYRKAPSLLSVVIGKNIPGDAVVGNISKMPHLLVAGTTGSGKSVCLNSLILSILYRASPDDVKFIMIDPKMVEFRIYNGIPHLLTPVVTEPKNAASALQWAVIEMEKRYRLFPEVGARDIESYNKVLAKNDEKKLFQLVVIIDELADLMMTSKKEVEDSIVRVAQKGRAAGIHLVVATQSPRAEIITGLMKANIPSRIALKVASPLESRIIIDQHGAESLVGNGDMLYVPIGSTKPTRVQGTWVSDAERESVIEFIKRDGDATYDSSITDEMRKLAASNEKKVGARGSVSEDGEDAQEKFDELLSQAADYIFDSGQASTSMLQRRLRVGFARAGRIIDQLEMLGVIGGSVGSGKMRDILITKEQWKQIRSKYTHDEEDTDYDSDPE